MRNSKSCETHQSFETESGNFYRSRSAISLHLIINARYRILLNQICFVPGIFGGKPIRRSWVEGSFRFVQSIREETTQKEIQIKSFYLILKIFPFYLFQCVPKCGGKVRKVELIDFLKKEIEGKGQRLNQYTSIWFGDCFQNCLNYFSSLKLNILRWKYWIGILRECIYKSKCFIEYNMLRILPFFYLKIFSNGSSIFLSIKKNSDEGKNKYFYSRVKFHLHINLKINFFK